jgi:hypothetical protein
MAGLEPLVFRFVQLSTALLVALVLFGNNALAKDSCAISDDEGFEGLNARALRFGSAIGSTAEMEGFSNPDFFESICRKGNQLLSDLTAAIDDLATCEKTAENLRKVRTARSLKHQIIPPNAAVCAKVKEPADAPPHETPSEHGQWIADGSVWLYVPTVGSFNKTTAKQMPAGELSLIGFECSTTTGQPFFSFRGKFLEQSKTSMELDEESLSRHTIYLGFVSRPGVVMGRDLFCLKTGADKRCIFPLFQSDRDFLANADELTIMMDYNDHEDQREITTIPVQRERDSFISMFQACKSESGHL